MLKTGYLDMYGHITLLDVCGLKPTLKCVEFYLFLQQHDKTIERIQDGQSYDILIPGFKLFTKNRLFKRKAWRKSGSISYRKNI